MPQPKIILAGGSGFLGQTLARFLAPRWQIIILSRHPTSIPNTTSILWDAQSPGPQSTWPSQLENAAAVINLAGRSVNCRYTPQNRRAIMDSRIQSTRALGQAIAACKNPPAVWLNGSTATIYRHSLDTPMDELTGQIASTPAVHDAFSIAVATAWEQTLADAPTPHTRKLALRTGIVLGPGPGGPFHLLHQLVRLHLGGTLGNGRQFISWIHHLDFCRSLEHLITTSTLSGPINITAPNPTPNRAFMQAFRTACHKPLALPAPRPLLKLATFFLRTEAELMLKSRRVLPTRLLNSGFTFTFPQIQPALNDLCTNPGW